MLWDVNSCGTEGLDFIPLTVADVIGLEKCLWLFLGSSLFFLGLLEAVAELTAQANVAEQKKIKKKKMEKQN